MKNRKKQLGNKNLIGKRVTILRKEIGITQKVLMAKMQAFGVDINYSSLSKLEGQTRIATDREMLALSKIFDITLDELVNKEC